MAMNNKEAQGTKRKGRKSQQDAQATQGLLEDTHGDLRDALTTLATDIESSTDEAATVAVRMIESIPSLFWSKVNQKMTQRGTPETPKVAIGNLDYSEFTSFLEEDVESLLLPGS